jgi:hypothetical protein
MDKILTELEIVDHNYENYMPAVVLRYCITHCLDKTCCQQMTAIHKIIVDNKDIVGDVSMDTIHNMVPLVPDSVGLTQWVINYIVDKIVDH